MSGDMYSLIQFYVLYRMKEDSPEYWEKSFNNFLKLVPKKFHIREKYSQNTINKKIRNDIAPFIVKPQKNSNKTKKSKIKTTNKTPSHKLTMREAERLLGESTNKSLTQMKNF